MTKNVLFYARYSTDRQNEVSLETQIELGKSFIEDKGWTLAATYSDAAVSGTRFTSRPGIQNLLRHVKRGGIDIVLCVTVDRLSRDVEHSSKILKEVNYHDATIWTVQAGQAVTNMELHLRSTLSHEMVEQIRYRTREGMKTAVRKGKASTCLAYGYMLSQQRDGNGDRIKGLREVDPVKAEIVGRIFKMYADGVSPNDIAEILNKEAVPGPRGKAWRILPSVATRVVGPASSTMRAMSAEWSGTSASTARTRIRSGGRRGLTMPVNGYHLRFRQCVWSPTPCGPVRGNAMR